MSAKHLAVLFVALAVMPFACRAIGFTDAIATEIALFAMVGLGFALTGHDGFLPVTVVGAMGAAFGIVVLAINLWRNVGPLRRGPSLSVPSARAVV